METKPAGLARKIEDAEWDAAQRVTLDESFPRLRPEQIRVLREWVSQSTKAQKNYPLLHNTLNALILVALFSIDIGMNGVMPSLMNLVIQDVNIATGIAGVLMGLIHGFVGYSIVTFSLHEGAAHGAIIQVLGKPTQVLAWLANNACRFYFGDPIYYKANHALHHQKFATRGDGAFSNFVSSRRILLSLLPFAHVFGITDYSIHRPLDRTMSTWISVAVSVLYMTGLIFIAFNVSGLTYALLAFVFIGPWVGYSLDRLRETSEHILMPLDYYNGSRSLGVGFWGILIGGGPWGQPCHLSHHFGANLSWYNQIRFHRELLKMLSLEQREVFIVDSGFFGYPKFVLRAWRQIRQTERELIATQSAQELIALQQE